MKTHTERRSRRSADKRRRRTPQEIRHRLLEAARAEFQAKGYAGATTAAISRRAEVAEIQMFRYFASKAALFQEAVFAPLEEHFRSFNEQHIPNAVDAASTAASARLYMAELLSFLEENADMLVSLFVAQTYAADTVDDGAAGRRALQGLFDHMADVMASRAAQVPSLDPGAVVRVAFGSVLGCITYRRWLFSEQTDPEVIRHAITEFVLAAITPHSDLAGATGT